MQRDKYLGMNMMRITQSAFACLFLTLGGCSYFHAAPALRPALPTNGCKPTAVVDSNKAGIARYNERRMEAAKEKFLAAVEQGPKCAEAHYNLGLVLNYMGAKDEAREHFIEAANLAPGNQVCGFDEMLPCFVLRPHVIQDQAQIVMGFGALRPLLHGG